MRPFKTVFSNLLAFPGRSAGRAGILLVAAAVLAAGAWFNPGVVITPAKADAKFQRYVQSLWPTARKRGISRATFDAAFKDVNVPDPEIWEKDAHQPEFKTPASQYISLAVSDTRIESGTKLLEEHAELLERIENKYKVDRHVLVAIWGMETSYGTFMGNKYVIQALATLGYKGRRTKFGRTQLMAALKILEQGHTTPERMEGSWAGAMGHTQFIPTTYTGNAVDFDGDGRRDIWDTLPDALGSTANYLKKSGWQYGKTWGYEVVLPSRFNTRLAGMKRRSSLAQWRKLGIKRVNGEPFPRPSDRASLYLPMGRKGPAFLVLKNFRVIMRYNAATKYALGVGHLSDRIRGYPAFSKPWPDGVRPLDSNERRELQEMLLARGFAIGEVDGIIGSKTREALRSLQKQKGMKADGFPSPKLLETLRQEAPPPPVQPQPQPPAQPQPQAPAPVVQDAQSPT